MSPVLSNLNNINTNLHNTNRSHIRSPKGGTLCKSFLVCEAIGTAATPGLLCQPRVIVKMTVEKQMEYRLAGETEVLGENQPRRHFCPSQNPTWPDPGLNPGRSCEKLATNRLNYGAAFVQIFVPLNKTPTDLGKTWNFCLKHFFIWTLLNEYLLTYGAEPFLRSWQLCSHSGTSQQF
jgi:hypothetical protein